MKSKNDIYYKKLKEKYDIAVSRNLSKFSFKGKTRNTSDVGIILMHNGY